MSPVWALRSFGGLNSTKANTFLGHCDYLLEELNNQSVAFQELILMFHNGLEQPKSKYVYILGILRPMQLDNESVSFEDLILMYHTVIQWNFSIIGFLFLVQQTRHFIIAFWFNSISIGFGRHCRCCCDSFLPNCPVLSFFLSPSPTHSVMVKACI